MVLGGQDLLEPFAVGDPHNPLFFILNQEGRVVNVKVVLLLPASFDQGRRRDSADLHNQLELFLLIVPREERLTGEKFS